MQLPLPARIERMWAQLERRVEARVIGRADALPFTTLPCALPFGVNAKTIAPAADSMERGLTLVTQLSLDRLDALAHQVSEWAGPVSAAIYIPHPVGSPEAGEALAKVARAYRNMGSPAAANTQCHAFTNTIKPEFLAGGKCELRLSFLWASDPDCEDCASSSKPERVSTKQQLQQEYNQMYPVNALRNLALSAAGTELVLLLDVDFVPSRGAHSLLVNTPGLYREAMQSNVAFVLPAFEAPKGGVLPLAFNELYSKWSQDQVTAFHVKHFAKGHAPSDYPRWFLTSRGIADKPTPHSSSVEMLSSAYEVAYQEFYEPYVVMRKSLVPECDERFRGYGTCVCA
jgi:glycosyltransferase-like protein LARGE